MKRILFFSILLASSHVASAYESTYDRIEWGQRGDDSHYCLDITNEQGEIAYGLQAIACGEHLYEFSPKSYVRGILGYDLPEGYSFFWKTWSPSGYGQAGFEGRVTVGQSCQGLPFSSTAQSVQWGCRQQDIEYCIDILDNNNNMLNQAVACGNGLHNYNPSSLNLPAGDYRWKVWSNSGYGETGFEGDFQVAAAQSTTALGAQLYIDNCVACHGANPANGRNGIRKAADPNASRRAINNNVGGMGYLSFLSDTELADIAAYVQNPNPTSTQTSQPTSNNNGTGGNTYNDDDDSYGRGDDDRYEDNDDDYGRDDDDRYESNDDDYGRDDDDRYEGNDDRYGRDDDDRYESNDDRYGRDDDDRYERDDD